MEREAAAPPLWTPYPDSPQSRAIESPADITGYGGQAGGGKTDLVLGLACTRHRHSMVFRKEFPQFRSMIERAHEIIGDKGRFNGQEKVFRLDDGRRIELGAVQYDQDKGKYRGRPHDLKAYDEATEILESIFWFTMGWLRSTHPGQRCRAILTFNPPSDAKGRWVLRLFAPWLDRKFPDPAAPGELRWFARVDGKLCWRDDGEPFVHEGEAIVPKSITFFPSKLSDNPILAATGYGSQLQSLPEPLRSQLLYGDFDAGVQDGEWQVIPTAWVLAAMERWKALGGDEHAPDVPLTCIGTDVAHGGADSTVLAPRHASFIKRLLVYPGRETPDGKSAAALVVLIHEPGASINVDAIGYGAPCYEKLSDPEPEGYGIETAYPVNFGERSNYTDRSGRFKCVNKRAEAYWRLRDALDPEDDADLALPDDPELLADLTAPTYQVTPSGIKVEPKADIKARLGRSPDKGDAVTLSLMPEPFVFIQSF